MANEKIRLDLAVMEARGFSREYSREIIEAGQVLVDGKEILKPGAKVEAGKIMITAQDMRYVGRGGYKLEAALDNFGITLDGLICIDAGASTGGFTDCMLKRGADRVLAVDVGCGQLSDILKSDERVTFYEKTDIRSFQPKTPADFLAADLSFISLTKVIPAFVNLLKDSGRVVCLIKPEFEAGKGFLNKNGVVTDKKAHEKSVENVKSALSGHGFSDLRVMISPIKGRSGNIEFLITAVRSANCQEQLPLK